MTDNELIAEFDGLVFECETGRWCLQLVGLPPGCWMSACKPEDLPYNKDYDALMPAWFKFRNIDLITLDLQIQHKKMCNRIAYRITSDEIWVACRYLADAIKWYNSLSKT